MSENDIHLVGNVVKEPTVFDTRLGRGGRLRMAVNTKRGEEKEETLFIDVKLFGPAFSDFEYYSVSRGDKVVVSGRLVLEEFKGKTGNDMRDYVVYANSIIKAHKKNKTTQTSSFTAKKEVETDEEVAF